MQHHLETKFHARVYAYVPPVTMVKDMKPPRQQLPYYFVNAQLQEPSDDIKPQECLERIQILLANKQGLYTDISWSAFFASQQKHNLKPPAITSLLLLFRDAAHTPAMIKHGMDILRSGQTSVLIVDQPLYAIAKR